MPCVHQTRVGRQIQAVLEKKGKQGKSFKAVKNIDCILVFYFLKAFYYPEHVGLAIGKADSPKVVFLEVHYDNLQHLEGTENLVMGS